VNEEWSASVDPQQNTITHPSLLHMEITADIVDPKEMNHELQQRLGEELVEWERNAALVKVVEGCWCNPRVMKLVHSHAAHNAPVKTFRINFPAKIDTFRHTLETFTKFLTVSDFFEISTGWHSKSESIHVLRKYKQ
jgi:hypothetical protein